MAVNERSIPAVLPQVVPPIEGPLIGSAFAYRSETQIGTARKDFLEGLVIALLAFAIGLAVGAALCISRR
jgi:hypothetical protein